MKKEELTVGDWVIELKTHKLMFVCEIGVCTLSLKDPNEFGYYYAMYSDVEPVPLSIEILEKIGFQQRGEYYHITIEDEDTRYCVEYDILSGKLTINNTWFVMNEVSYVHKLQQLLKLNKINKPIEL